MPSANRYPANRYFIQQVFSVHTVMLLLWFLFFQVEQLAVGGLRDWWGVLANTGFALSLYIAIHTLRMGNTALRVFGTFIRLVVSVETGLFSAALVYCLETGGSLSNATFGAILQTSYTEAAEFVSLNFLSLKYGTAFSGGSLFTWFMLGGCHSLCFPQLSAKSRRRVAAVSVCCWLMFSFCLVPIAKFIEAKAIYQGELVALENIRNNISLLPDIVAKKTQKGELYVIVLGESACRDFMQAYGAEVPNTPWLAGMKKNPGFVQFQNAYSNNVSTMPALCAALETGNWYTGITFPYTHTLLDVSKSVGIHTFWLSNQTRYASVGTPVTAIAEFADNVVFVNPGVGGLWSARSDMRLLPCLDEALSRFDRSANTLVILHIAGSHIPYANRYPPQTSEMLPIDDKQLEKHVRLGYAKSELKAYHTSLLETDRFLQQVFERVEAVSDVPAVLIYMSDHGEDPRPEYYHNADRFTWPMARIPFVVWLSPDYRRRYPGRLETLQKNSNKVLTNDLLFDLYTGLADIGLQGKSEHFDISSPEYRLTPDEAVTVFGKISIKDDPGLHLKKID